MNLTEFRKLVTPKVIAANWTEAVSNKIPYLGETLFPSKQKAGLDLKWVKGFKGLPVSLMPSMFDAKATFRSREGIKMLETEMPFFREGFKIKEKDRQEILRIREKNDPYLTDALNRVFDDAGNLLDGALVVAEREIMQLLFPENGDVGITITGGSVTNVFGGGSHSISGGTTAAGDVTITVSGGDISGAIYARGQLDGDSVTSAEVIFTGANSYGCDVYGYGHVGGEATDAKLNFTGYTGEFSGAIGGFDGGITLGRGTNMTLTTAADDIANASWEFDVAERAATLAGTALLKWDAADFTGDVITLNLAAGSANEWSLVDAATDTNYGKFDVRVD